MGVALKKLRAEDLDMVAEWRMSPEVTRWMNTDPVLTHEGQLEWFGKLSTDETQLWWVVTVDGVPAGVLDIIHIDHANQKCEWGYYIAVREKRSMKLAVELEWNLYDYAFGVLGMNRLYNEVLSGNAGVVKLHQLCGSMVEGELKQSVFKNGEFYDVTLCAILKEQWEAKKATVKYDTIPFE